VSRGNEDRARGGMDLAESSIELLRSAPLQIHAAYYIGALPFVTGLVLFWNHMSHAAMADRQLAPAALGLALLFVWLKTWQSRYCQELAAHLRGITPHAHGFRGFLRVLGRQALFQGLGLFVLPVAFILVLPFPWVYAFFQSLTVLDDGEARTTGDYLRDAFERAQMKPRQNIIMMWLLCPVLLLVNGLMILVVLPSMIATMPLFTETILYLYFFLLVLSLLPLSPFPMAILINVGIGTLFVANILRSLFGIESVLVSVPGIMTTPALWAIWLALSWLLLDPLLKAAYVLRCFEGHAQRTGEDLLLALRRFAGHSAPILLVVAGIFLTTLPATAAEPAVDSASLQAALETELDSSRYRWRMPRETQAEAEPGSIASFFDSMLRAMRDGINKLLDWAGAVWEWLFPPSDSARAAAGTGFIQRLQDSLRIVLVVLAGMLIGASIYLLYRNRRNIAAAALALAPQPGAPDLEDEDTRADALPTEGWIAMAQQHLAQGEYRLAARAAYLAMLATLAEEQKIVLARYKTNHDYSRELKRFAHVLPELSASFTTHTRAYEAVWYGDRPAEPSLVSQLLEQQDWIRHHGTQ